MARRIDHTYSWYAMMLSYEGGSDAEERSNYISGGMKRPPVSENRFNISLSACWYRRII